MNGLKIAALALLVVSSAVGQSKEKSEPARVTPQEVVSAELCGWQSLRKDTLDEIAKQKKYSRAGGVVNLKDMADLQGFLREADEGIEAAHARSKRLALKMLPCSGRRVAEIAACFHFPRNVIGVAECETQLAKEARSMESDLLDE